jgi:hypothetical protein
MIHEIVTEHLHYKKKGCARWVPKILTDAHKEKRMATVLTFLKRYHKDGDEFLDHTVTGDETWIAHITPESKQQSLQWWHTGSPMPKKFKQTLLAQKIMATALWDCKGILLMDFMTQE